MTAIASLSDSIGARLVTATDVALVHARLRVVACGGFARVVCEQRFQNRSAEPLHVTYSLPLPADAAVSGFCFVIGERRVVGEIDKKESARERFEEALSEGRTAALLDQERSSLFTQELGNIPPGAEIVAEVTLDQRLAWTDAGEWEWRFPTTVMPRYLGEPGRVADAKAIVQDIADSELSARLSLAMSVQGAPDGSTPSSPSHALRSSPSEGNALDIEFASEAGVRLDRDVVVRFRAATKDVGIAIDVSRPQSESPVSSEAFGVLTLVPPEASARTMSRDLVVLLDTSGSMSGQPLEQARRVVLALLSTLTEEDSIELIEFSDRARRFRNEPARADAKTLSAARTWLAKLRASGSTEMSDAIVEALGATRKSAQRQVVLITDGAIGFETEVVSAICQKLPANSRLHTVGVGSAVNRSLTASAARAGRGVEIIIGLGEDAEPLAARLVRRTSRPVLVELEVRGSALIDHVPARLPDVFAGAPVLIATKLRPQGGDLIVTGKQANGERWQRRLTIAQTELGTGNPQNITFYGRERVEDLELAVAAGGSAAELDAQIERTGLAFQIPTRKTSWVAVSEEVTVDPTKPSRRVRVPHELPHGASIAGLGLRAGGPMVAFAAPAPRMMSAPMPTRSRIMAPVGAPPPAPPASAAPRGKSLFAALRSFVGGSSKGSGTTDGESSLESDAASDSRTLDGKILLSKPRILILEITITDGELDWRPGATALVAWPDGTTLEAKINPDRSTAPEAISIGQTVRLFLEFSADKPNHAPSTVQLPTASLIIQLTT